MSPASNERGEEQAMYYENHPVYTEQRLKLSPTFSGKTSQIEAQFHNYWQAPAIDPTRKEWEKQILAQNDKYEIISNWASFDVLQYPDKPAQAGMSMIHLLAIPRDPVINGKYLFNAVDLDIESVGIIDGMIDLFEHAWTNPTVRRRIWQHQVDAVEIRAKKMRGEPFADQARDAAFAHCEELRSVIDDIDVKDFRYGLHLRPDSSAPYLHLHIIAAPYDFRKYSTSEHDRKTKDAPEVRDFIIKEARSKGTNRSGSPSVSGEGALRSRVQPL